MFSKRRNASLFALLSLQCLLTTGALSFGQSVIEPKQLNHGPALYVTAGSDPAVWFTEYEGNSIGRVGLIDARISEYVLPQGSRCPYRIVQGPDAALWFTESCSGKIGRITTSGQITEYNVPATGENSMPAGIASGPDGALWFTDLNRGSIWRITVAGFFTEYPLAANSLPLAITAGPDQALWFTLAGAELPKTTLLAAFPRNLLNTGFTRIGRISTAGVITTYPTPTRLGFPNSIVAGPDGALWFTVAAVDDTENGNGKIGSVTTGGFFTEYPVLVSWEPVHHGLSPIDITATPNGVRFTAHYAGCYFGSRPYTYSGPSSYWDSDFIGSNTSSPQPVPYRAWGLAAAGPSGNLWYAATPFDGACDAKNPHSRVNPLPPRWVLIPYQPFIYATADSDIPPDQLNDIRIFVNGGDCGYSVSGICRLHNPHVGGVYGFYSIASRIDQVADPHIGYIIVYEKPKTAPDATTLVALTPLPETYVRAVQDQPDPLAVDVTWTGGEDVVDYTIYVTDGPRTLWQHTTGPSSAKFIGLPGHSYYFSSIGRDAIGTEGPESNDMVTLPQDLPPDVNGDGLVNCADIGLVKGVMGKRVGQPGFNYRYDVNLDRVIDIRDLAIVARSLPSGTRCP